jgi:hypothetical protein
MSYYGPKLAQRLYYATQFCTYILCSIKIALCKDSNENSSAPEGNLAANNKPVFTFLIYF